MFGIPGAAGEGERGTKTKKRRNARKKNSVSSYKYTWKIGHTFSPSWGTEFVFRAFFLFFLLDPPLISDREGHEQKSQRIFLRKKPKPFSFVFPLKNPRGKREDAPSIHISQTDAPRASTVAPHVLFSHTQKKSMACHS